MKVVFLNSFKKDLQKLTNTKLKAQIKEAILSAENAENINQLKSVKKMKGHPFAYRLRIGDYRLGFYLEEDTLIMTRFLKRNDIYKVFP